MLSEQTIVAQLGLPAREATVIRSLFQLVPALQDSFRLVEGREAAKAHVVFVNSELRTAMSAWEAIADKNPMAVPVLVVGKDGKAGSGLRVRRPLVLKKLLDVLQQVTSTQPRAVEKVGAGSPRILVVDDSFPMRTFMEHRLPVLAPCAVIVDMAESGSQAKEKIAACDYDLIFLDIVMPDIDGYKLCKWVKANHPTAVVMLTSKSGSFDKVRGAVAGSDTYLTKPPDEQRLSEVLCRFVPAALARPALS